MISNDPEIKLRPTKISDLKILFQFQPYQDGGYLAAFMPKYHTDQTAYLTKHSRLLEDPTVSNQTILPEGNIVGSIGKFILEGDAEIPYWIDRKHWGMESQLRL